CRATFCCKSLPCTASAVDRRGRVLPHLRLIVFLLLELEVVRAAQPDDRLSNGIDPVVVFAVWELSAFADHWGDPVAIHVPDAALLEWHLGCVRPALLGAIR